MNGWYLYGTTRAIASKGSIGFAYSGSYISSYMPCCGLESHRNSQQGLPLTMVQKLWTVKQTGVYEKPVLRPF